jgi:hypothetical protein
MEILQTNSMTEFLTCAWHDCGMPQCTIHYTRCREEQCLNYETHPGIFWWGERNIMDVYEQWFMDSYI